MTLSVFGSWQLAVDDKKLTEASLSPFLWHSCLQGAVFFRGLAGDPNVTFLSAHLACLRIDPT